MQTDRKTISVTEAAVFLGVSRNTAYQAVRQGSIPSIRVGRRVLVPVHALYALLSLEPLQAATS
ncbi:MAG: helix-turn-helix domain-containing protein [Armatimonadetes bacterium]|nr:helix-turn-helix domain-containing protein [Armatimonadota bacterium]